LILENTFCVEDTEKIANWVSRRLTAWRVILILMTGIYFRHIYSAHLKTE
jgi:hypothetical protein